MFRWDEIVSNVGLAVGFGTAKKVVADALGTLYHLGTKLTPTAAEINKLAGNKVVKSITGTIAFDVADPFTVALGTIPNGAIVTHTLVEISTAFNAATTNVLTVGTAADATTLVAAADVNEAALGATVVAHSATMSADTAIVAKYTQTGTAATAGAARVTVFYLV